MLQISTHEKEIKTLKINQADLEKYLKQKSHE